MNYNLTLISPPPAIPLGINLFGETMTNLLAPKIINFNSLIFAFSVGKILKSSKIQNPILWLWHPLQLNLIGKFNEKIIIYYVYDELGEYPHNLKAKNILEKLDERLCKKADIIFTSSRSQCDKRKSYNSNIYFIPNAVDFCHFNKAVDQATEIPQEIKYIKKPIIGFIGYLAFHIDVKLLICLAKSHSGWSIVLVGPNDIDKDKKYNQLKDMENVFFLGEKSREEVPSYLKSFDVAIMPYNMNTHVVNSYPLKLHEYLAGGKPIVAVELPELLPYRNVVRLATSQNDFVKQIKDRKLVKASFCGNVGCEDLIKDKTEGATSRLIPLQQPKKIGKCVHCNKEGKFLVIFGKAY